MGDLPLKSALKIRSDMFAQPSKIFVLRLGRMHVERTYWTGNHCMSFRDTLRGCEYSIWATNARKITRKDTPDLLFRLPKSSFGRHTLSPLGRREYEKRR